MTRETNSRGRLNKNEFTEVRVSQFGTAMPGLISFRGFILLPKLPGPFLPFLDEHDEELVTKVEEPSTFLGAREATTAKRGKGEHSEEAVELGPPTFVLPVPA